MNKYKIGGLLLALVLSLPAHAAERILSFHSEIQVHPDSEMTVTETIRVLAERRAIKHGIYRDFPTRYKTPNGGDFNVGFEVLDVQRDGAPESWHSGRMKNGVRIYMGKKKTLVTPGEHTYKFTYRTNRQLGYFDDHDELYWNVTGTGWVFPIDQASARVTLTGGAPMELLTVTAYTGRQGSKASAAAITRDAQGWPIWKTTQPLGRHEGLTLVLGWPKGVVAEPGLAQKFKWFLRDNKGLLGGLGALLLAFIAYLFAWLKVGRDPKRDTIMPRFTPPQDMSPQAVYYLANMRYDPKAFSAAIIDLAVRGYHTIEDKAKRLVFLTRSADSDNVDLPDDEAALVENLFGDKEEVKIQRGQYRLLGKAQTAVKKVLKAKYEGSHFSRNGRYVIPGLAVSILGLIVAGPSASPGFVSVFISSLIPLGIIALLVLGQSALNLSSKFVIGILGLFLVANLVGLTDRAGFGFVILLLLATVMAGVFYRLMRAWTPEGRKLMDEIEGFRMYLETAEQDRLNALNPPERTPALFEKYLPYALALGVENQWAEQFSDVLAKAAQGESSYHPHWYTGSYWDSARPAAFATAVGAGLASTIAAASTAPGSSSSGGGGGFSGGGGGGGGGGGW